MSQTVAVLGTFQTEFKTHHPEHTFAEQAQPGWRTYRVGLMANWLDDPTRGDVLMISKPVRVKSH